MKEQIQSDDQSLGYPFRSFQVPFGKRDLLQNQAMSYADSSHEIEIRVRYPETDPGGYVHHANYFIWFEMGRTELLRAQGRTYKDMEAEGLFIVVVKAACKYLRPARYDDVLRLRTTVTRVRAATVEHDYHLYRGEDLLAEAHVTLCCVDGDGNPQRLPVWIMGQ